jgi:hypothetical protein
MSAADFYFGQQRSDINYLYTALVPGTGLSAYKPLSQISRQKSAMQEFTYSPFRGTLVSSFVLLWGRMQVFQLCTWTMELEASKSLRPKTTVIKGAVMMRRVNLQSDSPILVVNQEVFQKLRSSELQIATDRY